MKTFRAILALMVVVGVSHGKSAKASLEVQSHTAGEAGFSVNSHLILGAKEAILVDAQFTRSEARKVSQMVKNSGRELKTIFITHGHPDHYFGLEILNQDFPKAKILASPQVVSDIQKTANEKLKYWKGIYKEDLTDKIILPEAYSGTPLELEGNVLPIINLEDGESEHMSVLYIPSLRAAVTGDVLYSDVHLWLAENRPEGWLKNLETLAALDATRFLPGHGSAGTEKLIEEDKRYIDQFLLLTQRKNSRESAIAGMKQAFPDYKLPIILDLSVQARIK